MTAQVHIFEPLFLTIDTVINNAVSTMVSYSGSLKGVVAAFWLLYCCYQAFRLISNEHHFQIYNEVIRDLTRVSLICFFAFNTGNYLSNIVPIIRDSGSDLASLISNNHSNVNSQLDKFVTLGLNLIGTQLDKISITSPSVSFSAILYILLIGVGMLTFLVAGTVLLIMVNIATAMLAIIGLLFIIFLIFPVTRGWFFSWLAQCANYILLNVLFSITVALSLKVTQGVLSAAVTNSYGDLLTSAVGVFLVVSAFSMIIIELPSFTASLVGSSGMSSIGRGGEALTGTAANVAQISKTMGMNKAMGFAGKGLKSLAGNLKLGAGIGKN